MISKRLVLINSASSLLTKLASIAVMIWVQQFLLKRIPVEEYSLLPVVYSLSIFLPLLTEVLAGGIKRYVLEAFVNRDAEGITRIVSTMFPLLCLGGMLIIALGGVIAWKVEAILNISPKYVDLAREMILLVFGIEALRLAAKAFDSGLFVTQRFVLQNLISISCELLRTIALLFLLLEVTVSVSSVVYATAVGSIAEIIVLLLASRHFLPNQKFRFARFNADTFKVLLHFGGWSSLNVVAGLTRKMGDPIILNRLATPLDVACFNLGALIPNRMEVIMNQSILGSILPPIIALNASGQHEKLRKLYLRIGRYALWGTLSICGPFIVFNQPIVRLYVGSEFQQAGTVLLLLLACYPLVYGNALYTVLANAKVQMKSMAIRESLSSLLNLGLTIVLIGYFGMGAVGSALATFLIYGLGSLAIFIPFGKDMAGATWPEYIRQTAIPGVIPFFTTSAMLKVLDLMRPAEFWADIFFYSLLGGVLYLAMVWVIANEHDRLQFKGVFLVIWRKLYARG